MSLLRITHGENDRVYTDDGRSFIDVISSTGAVFLGHANETVNRHVAAQLDRLSCSWTSAMAIQDECKERVAGHIDEGFSLYSLYSSGMEAAEVAMRMAFHETGRSRIIGFQHNNHGKSVATQNLTGDDPDIPRFDTFSALPFLPDHSEADILGHFERAVSSSDTAAVFIEAMQGKGGGHSASPAFYGEVQRLCREHGVLIVCDEIFTGFYRTGPCFHYPVLDIEPDIVLVGKAFSNGFPAAGVLLNERLTYHPKDFRFGSTFSDNPLACAAVIGTLAEMERIEIEKRVAQIEQVFGGLEPGPTAQLRLWGAACFVELDSDAAATTVHDHLYRHNVLTLRRGAVLGFWPPATISDDNLEYVVSVTNDGFASLP